MSDDFLASITVRVSYSFRKFLKENSGQGKKFRDMSEGLRHYCELGKRTEKLIEIRKDPEKQKEFEEKLQSLMQFDNMESVLDGMSEDELDSVILLAENLKTQKVQQVLDLVTKG